VDPLATAHPDQPPTADAASGTAVNVTLVPASKGALQVVPQSIPAGSLVTVPLPEPASVTVTLAPPPQAASADRTPAIMAPWTHARRRGWEARTSWQVGIVLTIGTRA